MVAILYNFTEFNSHSLDFMTVRNIQLYALRMRLAKILDIASVEFIYKSGMIYYKAFLMAANEASWNGATAGLWCLLVPKNP